MVQSVTSYLITSYRLTTLRLAVPTRKVCYLYSYSHLPDFQCSFEKLKGLKDDSKCIVADCAVGMEQICSDCMAHVCTEYDGLLFL
jgi:hypothetical protein